MNRICFLALIFVITLCNKSLGQISEGKITYSLEFPDLNLPAEQKALLPTESVTYFKEGKSRSESDGMMGMKTITISTDKEIIMLLDIMGEKSAIRKDLAAAEKPNKVEITTDTKRIAGYDCQKAIISANGNDHMEVWFTKSITGGGTWGGTFDKISGAPMEFSMDNGGINFKMTAVSVKQEKVNSSMFTIPVGYKETTEEELRNNMYNK